MMELNKIQLKYKITLIFLSYIRANIFNFRLEWNSTRIEKKENVHGQCNFALKDVLNACRRMKSKRTN